MTEFMEMGETLSDIAQACELVGHEHGTDLARAVAFIIEERARATALLQQVYGMSMVRALDADLLWLAGGFLVTALIFFALHPCYG